MNIQHCNNGIAAALGNFDGMHLGHVAVMSEAWSFFHRGLIPCVVLFDEHTQKAITGKAPSVIMTLEDRMKFITERGFASYTLNFESIKNLSPREFVSDVLVKQLNTKAVACGYNYRFGRNAVGDASTMAELCNEYGIECHIVGEVDSGGCAVSSTAIRKAIEAGEIEKANSMLGREFSFKSKVIHGDARGRTWGFPTINQMLPDNMVMPKFGVYASVVTVDDDEYKGVTNIGKRPTIGTDFVLSETNIIGFDGDLYGRNIEIKLIKFLRNEKKFASFDELAKQIDVDTEIVKRGE